ncbi:MAG: hypothetical protein IJ735_01095 [Clostridia bacterium]|nr:hypothetical protein [Clostridia bacterium]
MSKSIGIPLVIFTAMLVLLSAILVPIGEEAFCDESLPIGVDLDEFDAAIEYHSYTLSGNGLYYRFSVTVDDDLFLSSGSLDNQVFSPSPVFDELKELLTRYGYSVVSDGKQNGKFVASFEYEDTVDYYIANGITGYEPNVRSGKEEEGFLFTDYTRVMTTPFVSIETEGSLLNEIWKKVLSLGAAEDKVLLIYVYGTPYQIVKTDADRVEYKESSSIYLHSFDMTYGTASREIEIRQHAPNPTGWYVIAFLCALPIIAAPLSIMIYKRRKGGFYA